MRTNNQVIDKIDHQLTKDNRKLVPRHKRTAFVRRRNLRNIHRADSRSQSDTDTAEDTIAVKNYQ